MPICSLHEAPMAIESFEWQEEDSKEEKNLDDEDAIDKIVTKKSKLGLFESLYASSNFSEDYTLFSIESKSKDYPPEN